MNWKTKPSDRFVLKFIKLYLSAPISARVARYAPNARPALFTFTACGTGILAGIVFGLGSAFTGAILAACAQVLDGVDGQVARLTQRSSLKGAMLDSFMDRYMDFALIFGLFFYCIRLSCGESGILSTGWLVLITALAAAGSSQISYTTARAASLNLDFKRPEGAGKGSRTAAIIICGLLSPLWIHFPLLSLFYLAIHPNIAAILSIYRLQR
jgi:phosphatidylglycerophosphate synthase